MHTNENKYQPYRPWSSTNDPYCPHPPDTTLGKKVYDVMSNQTLHPAPQVMPLQYGFRWLYVPPDPVQDRWPKIRLLCLLLNVALVVIALVAFGINNKLRLMTTRTTRFVKDELGHGTCFPIPSPRNSVPSNLTRCIEFDIAKNPATVAPATLIVLIVTIDFAASVCFYFRTFGTIGWLGYREWGERERFVWVNYAVTSPLQVLLVAMLWAIFDNFTLTLLVVAQFALIFCGEICERCYDIMSKSEGVLRDATINITLAAQLIAWALFWVIWGVLLANFVQVQSEFGDHGMPDELVGVFIGQLILFFFFGLHSLILWYLAYLRKGIDWEIQSLVHMVLSSSAKAILASCYLVYVIRSKKM